MTEATAERFVGCGDMLEEVRSHADAAIQKHEAAIAMRREGLLSVNEIFAPLPPVDWLCQPLDMAAGAPVLFAGYGFSGKTVSAQDLALAVATGGRVWGMFNVRKGRVLHLDYEQGAYLTRTRYQRLARARGLSAADLEGSLVLAPLPSWYLDNDAQDRLARLAEGFDLLVVDSFRAACPGTDENSSDARIPLDRLNRIAERTGATPVVIHHARKPTRDAQGGARMSIRGSGAMYDACGSVLVFAAEKGEPITVEHEKARISGRTHDAFRLHIVDVEIAGDPNAGLRVTALANADNPPAPKAFVELKRRILELLKEEGGIVTGGVNVLRARLDARKEDVSAAIHELEREHALIRGGTYRAPTLRLTGTDCDSR
ncbi:MAG: AAA family ATPase [Anaeromyxobacter sp.]